MSRVFPVIPLFFLILGGCSDQHPTDQFQFDQIQKLAIQEPNHDSTSQGFDRGDTSQEPNKGGPVPEIIEYGFAGTLDEAFGTIPKGTPFSGTFSYIYSQKNLSAASPISNRGDFKYSKITLTIGDKTITDLGTGVINLYDSGTYPTDLFALYTYNVLGNLGGVALAPSGLALVLQNLDGTAWSTNKKLPGKDLSMSSFDGRAASFIQLVSDRIPGDERPSDRLIVRGSITSLY